MHAALSGGPALRAAPFLGAQGDKLNMKIPGVGSPVQWHQDWAFYPHTNDDILAVGLAIDDTTLENGATQSVPRLLERLLLPEFGHPATPLPSPRPASRPCGPQSWPRLFIPDENFFRSGWREKSIIPFHTFSNWPAFCVLGCCNLVTFGHRFIPGSHRGPTLDHNLPPEHGGFFCGGVPRRTAKPCAGFRVCALARRASSGGGSARSSDDQTILQLCLRALRCRCPRAAAVCAL